MKSFLLLFLIHILSCFCYTQDTLYSSNTFTVTDNAVYEGEYEAVVLSPTEIKSNYESSFRPGVKRIIKFKFSLNGFDNERPPASDHFIRIEPENGKYITPVFVFGESDPEEIDPPDEDEIYLKNVNQMNVTFMLDIRKVLKEMANSGFYQCYDGSIVKKEDFTGVFIAGEEYPLTWDFDALKNSSKFKLTDVDSDSIYEININFIVNPSRPLDKGGYSHWKLKEDISNYPVFSSSILLLNAEYNLALEELIQNIRSDSTFMAGAKWPGIWTRDIAYSIYLSLAFLNPEIAKRSLMAKVNNDRIIQDTGTGGSWPVSTDRMTWSIAAWEIYKVTSDKEWLKTIFRIIKNSADTDIKSIINPQTGLFYGESSFLDWREQSYPVWMDPKDIYMSMNLGTNAVHYQTHNILSQIADILNEPSDDYKKIAQSLKHAINTYFWQAEKGYYGQFIYGRNYKTLSQKSESLGESLAILFGIANEDQSAKIISNMPVLNYGVPCFFPQIFGIPSYHNNGIWPFVQAFWTQAAAKTQNVKAVNYGIASILRASALFLTNKENFVASSGNFIGTETNSDRQLWSVAGSLSLYYRILLGMNFEINGIYFKPIIPESLNNLLELNNFKYHNSNLNIHVEGFGNKIDSFFVNDQYKEKPYFSNNLSGDFEIRIKMSNSVPLSSIRLIENHFTPNIENFEIDDDEISWEKIENDVVYIVLKNGKIYRITNDSEIEIPESNKSAEYQVMAIDEKGYGSFLSEPQWTKFNNQILIIQPDDNTNIRHTAYEGYSGEGYVPLTTSKNVNVSFPVTIENAGYYSIDFRYANGNGPINTDNKCAIRTLQVDSVNIASIVLPQRGLHQWTNWGYSNSVKVFLTTQKHTISIIFYNHNQNMNIAENVAFIDHLRLQYLNSE